MQSAQPEESKLADGNIVIYLIDGGCNASEETVQAR
jgi:hypothetical protein